MAEILAYPINRTEEDEILLIPACCHLLLFATIRPSSSSSAAEQVARVSHQKTKSVIARENVITSLQFEVHLKTENAQFDLLVGKLRKTMAKMNEITEVTRFEVTSAEVALCQSMLSAFRGLLGKGNWRLKTSKNPKKRKIHFIV
ncbi:hypothetical protein CEXT_337511 [Caerostris extrusa]|uniref:Uncharacterized protein n=1 Tax=Caerostris extrusa TaxID=172846 RepID=A0AAV4SQ89_CAEEX|nr:hypothetical protein CEXT_337511 [Caerostris extrusa]